MSPLSLVAGLILITLADELRGRITLGIFTLTAVTLFTCSALYHRVAWSDRNKAIWRRIDHSNIGILIAGTYTPFAIYLLEPNQAQVLLILAWGGAFISSLLRILWLSAPRWLYVAGYIALGWADEDLGFNCGTGTIKGGYWIEMDLEDDYTFACNLWGYDPDPDVEEAIEEQNNA